MMGEPRIRGRRREDRSVDHIPHDLLPGDYWKIIDYDLGDKYPSNLTRTAWRFMSPDGNGVGFLVLHTVRENEDGTINILPGDGSSNSVLHKGGAEGKVWHGYVYEGVWTPV